MSPLGRLVVGGHLAVTTVLAAINLSPLMASWSVSRLLEVNAENTVVVWFSSTSLLGLAALAARLASRMPRGERMGWSVVAAFFVLLSIDETASLHEYAGLMFSARVGEIASLPGLYAWVVVVAPPALIAALAMLWWMWRQIPVGNPARWLAPAAMGLWLLVPVAEVLDPLLGAPRPLVVAEETLELVGIALMLGALIELSSFSLRSSGRDTVPDRVLDRITEPV